MDVFGGGTVVYCGGIVAFYAPLALVFFCSSLMYCILLTLSSYHFIVCMFYKCFSLAFASSIVSVSSLNQALSSTCVINLGFWTFGLVIVINNKAYV